MPHWCKTAGLVIMVPLILAWLTVLLFGTSGKFLDALGNILDENIDRYIVLLSVSMLMAAFSRERDEDEYVASVRGKCLMLAFYIDFVFVLVTAFTVYGINYITIMMIQMFMILFLHIIMFNTTMAVIRRRRSHEE